MLTSQRLVTFSLQLVKMIMYIPNKTNEGSTETYSVLVKEGFKYPLSK